MVIKVVCPSLLGINGEHCIPTAAERKSGAKLRLSFGMTKDCTFFWKMFSKIIIGQAVERNEPALKVIKMESRLSLVENRDSIFGNSGQY